MAIYNLRVEPDRGRSAVYRYEYTLRVNDFSWEKDSKYNDFLFGQNVNMPDFASEDPKLFWESCENYERANANTFRTIDFSLPAELSDEENIELAARFAEELFGDKFVYSMAVHSKPSSAQSIQNIHCHIMFSERKLDGIERDPKEFFKRFNRKNPQLGGCEKTNEWIAYSKLYYIRQTWERIANEKLQEKGLEKISCRSLYAQRIDSLLEENYLKAELLDRPPIHLEKSYIDFYPDSNDKEKALEFFNYAKKIKEIKEKEFKLKCENFEEENIKARDRFLRGVCEIRGKEYVSSNFEVLKNQLEDTLNFQNIFVTSLENRVLLHKKEARIKQINSISDADIESHALNVLTHGEYSKKEDRFKELNAFEEKYPKRFNSQLEAEKEELQNYFKNLSDNEYFQNKLSNMKDNIRNKYAHEKEEIIKDLKFLRNNNFRDFYLESSPQNYERSKIFLAETKEYIEDLKVEKEEIEAKVSAYKKKYLDKDIKQEIYARIDSKIVERYNELNRMKEKLPSVESLDEHFNLEQKIFAENRYFRSFDMENNINEKVNEELKEHREEYKKLRQEQDDIAGKLNLSFLMMRELKKVNKINLLEREEMLYDEYHIKNDSSYFERFKYNTKLSTFKDEYKKAFNKSSKLQPFSLPKLSENDRKEFFKNTKKYILKTQKEIETLQQELANNQPTDERIRVSILDKYTDGKYSETLREIASYKKELESGNAYEYTSKYLEENEMNKKRFEFKFKITNEVFQAEKRLFQEKNMNTLVKLREKRRELKVGFKMLKKLKGKGIGIIRIKPRRPIKEQPLKKLKVVESGRIIIKDEAEESRKRGRAYEFEL
ncbi:MobA/MobL family protein (plasmid) [Fusobacterium sp. SB021]|uniref:MobA/MobL family protein n=1 Tax=Fusobacterium sp. SB021 TaxID=2744227 RepID=UPI003CF9E7E4